jgi:hypothetical protein
VIAHGPDPFGDLLNDQRTVRLVILLLGVIGVLIAAGGIYLAANDKAIPEALVALGGTVVGGLAGLLSQTNATPTPVQMIPVDPQALGNIR